MEQETAQLREYWLRQAAVFLLDHMQRCGLKNVAVRVSCGWPSSGGLGVGKMTVGECFSPRICADGIPQIFISPRVAESVEVLGILLHELIHASVGNENGHKKVFSQAARACGLEVHLLQRWSVTSSGLCWLSTCKHQVTILMRLSVLPLKVKKGSRLRFINAM